MDQKFLLTLILSYGLSSTDKKETFYHGIKDLSQSPFYLFSFISYLPFKLKKNLQITDYASSSCFCLFVHIVPFASRLQTAFHCLAVLPLRSTRPIVSRTCTVRDSPSTHSDSPVVSPQSVFFSFYLFDYASP